MSSRTRHAPESPKAPDVPRLMLLNKPFGVLTQFTSREERPTLRQLISAPGLYPAGRLDHDSEGLVLLTNWGALQARLTQPRSKVGKTYFAQVEGVATETALEQLRRGVKLSDGLTSPADARIVEEPLWLWPRDPPIRFRKNSPTSWMTLTIHEGRNRQVRRMTAAVGYPTLRLIRWSVGPWTLEGLEPGASRAASAEEIRSFYERGDRSMRG
jgi:23S rRNA pseudouridine2457 synthase